MSKSFFPVLFSLVCLVSSNATACIEKYVPQADITGQGRMSFMIWDVYDATLYATDGKFSYQKPFALRLNYIQNIAGDKIAETSIDEMKKQGFNDTEKLSLWHTRMKDIFPDVASGDELIGVFTGYSTVFCQKGKEIGVINDRAFGKHFFDIWLSEKTSAPDLRAKLTGQKK